MARAEIPAEASPIDSLGLAAAVLGAALFSTKPILVKFGYAAGTDPLTLLTLRMLCALPFYVVIGAFALRHSSAPPPKIMILAALNGLLGYYVASFLDFTALQEITAQLERLVLFTYPIFVVLLGAAFFGQPFKRWTLPAMLTAYSGLALVFIGNMSHAGAGNVTLGTLMVLGAALAFALFQLFGRELVRQIGPILYTSIAMSCASAGIMIHYALVNPIEALAVDQHTWMIAFAIAIPATVIPSYLINFALGRVGAATTAMTGNAGPLFTIALSAMLLGEPFGWLEATGTALVVSAMVLFSRK